MSRMGRQWRGLCVLLAMAATAQAQTTTRVSVATGGGQGNGLSRYSAISASGRYVTFSSAASNLVSGDTNSATDVFVHDRQTGTAERVSVATGGAQAYSEEFGRPSISGDGRYVVFESDATNLVSGDTNGMTDIFVRDRQDRRTTRISVADGGVQADSLSFAPVISSTGRFVAFHSYASNLVPGDVNNRADVFVHDRQTNRTRRVSVASGGAESEGGSSDSLSISADGRFVAFTSNATDLVPGDGNSFRDIFVHDRIGGQTSRLSMAMGGGSADNDSFSPWISSDGRFVAFQSWSSNLVTGDTNGQSDVFVHDRQTGQTIRVSVDSGGVQGNGESSNPSISSGGLYVAFDSTATNLVPSDTNGQIDVFLNNRRTGQTTRMSLSTAGVPGNAPSVGSMVSDSGQVVTFESAANNLVAGDANGTIDTFVRDLGAAAPTAMLTTPTSVPSCGGRTHPMPVSWTSEGTVFCRAEIPDAASPSVQADQCLRGGGLPARGSFWTSVRCASGLCPDPNDSSKLGTTRAAEIVPVCQGLLGLSPAQTSISLRLVCTTPSGSTVTSNRSVTVRAAQGGECQAPTYTPPASVASAEPAWGGGTELSGTVGNPPAGELTASLLEDSVHGRTTVRMEGNQLRMVFKENPGAQPAQITDTVTVVISDGITTAQQSYTFTVPSEYVFQSGFE